MSVRISSMNDIAIQVSMRSDFPSRWLFSFLLAWCGVEIGNISDAGYWKLTAAVNSTHFYYNRISLHLQG